MTLARVEIESTGPSSCTVKIDGKDVAPYVVGYYVTHRVGELPRVELQLVGLERFSGQADAVLPPSAVEALTALGWTPPLGRDLIGEAKTPAQASECGAQYPRPANTPPNTRIVRCDLPAGHDGDHMETDTKNTWPRG